MARGSPVRLSVCTGGEGGGEGWREKEERKQWGIYNAGGMEVKEGKRAKVMEGLEDWRKVVWIE